MDQKSIAVVIGAHIPKAAIVSFRTVLAGGVSVAINSEVATPIIFSVGPPSAGRPGPC